MSTPVRPKGAGILDLHPAADTLLAALRTQVRTGRLVRPSQLPLESPCPGWSVRDVLNHSIGVTLKFAGFAAGGSDYPRTPRGDLIGADHRLALRSAAEAAQAAWTSADMARPCHLPFGTFPASLAAGINLFDVLAHTWDIAVATGVPLECTDDLWQAGLEAARAVIGPGRDPRQYAAEIPVTAAASPRQRFLAFTGRAEPC
jgi:uncharacterized protein (TIGR03086 family)